MWTTAPCILSDEASQITGSIGMIPSSSLGDGSRGLYEPIHGSAPDIAGQDIANPIGMILAAAMMLRYSLDLPAEADAVEQAVSAVLERGLRRYLRAGLHRRRLRRHGPGHRRSSGENPLISRRFFRFFPSCIPGILSNAPKLSSEAFSPLCFPGKTSIIDQNKGHLSMYR